MKTFILTISAITLIYVNAYSQLGNYNMRLLANIQNHTTNYSGLWGYVDPKNGREYAIIGSFDGTSFVDITDTSNIHEVGFVPTPSINPNDPENTWREMKTYSHYAYIVSEVANSGVQIVDLQYLPDSVRYVKKFLFPGFSDAHTISQEGPFLYLNASDGSIGNGVTVLDLTMDPENPVRRGSYNVDYIHDSRIKNDTIYAANIQNSKVSIISAVNKDALFRITSFVNLPNSGPHNTAISSNGNFLFVTDEIGNYPRMLKLWYIADLGNITYISGWLPTGITTSIVHNVEVYGNFALLAHYTAGVRLVDFSNVDNLKEVAWFDTYPLNNQDFYNGCWAVYMFPSGKIIASDMRTGLYVLKPISLRSLFNVKMVVQGFYNTSSNQLNIRDTLSAYLRESFPPYNIVDSSKAVVSQHLFANFEFYNAPIGNYYLVLRHRNSIDTWSGSTLIAYDPFITNTYDFTNSLAKAYGNNMIQVDNQPLRYGVYSGDANGDNAIDISDLGMIGNDAYNFNSGYLVTDINGDNVIDLDDVTITDNNLFNFITTITP